MSYNMPGLSSNAAVKSISVNNYDFTEGDFVPATKNYSVMLPAGTKSVITAVETEDLFATVSNDGYFSTIPGTQTINITSEDGTASETYAIDYDLEPTAIDEAAGQKFAVYPIPTDGMLYLKVGDEFMGEVYKVTDLMGHILASEIIANSEFILDLTVFEPGIYLVSIDNCTKRILVK